MKDMTWKIGLTLVALVIICVIVYAFIAGHQEAAATGAAVAAGAEYYRRRGRTDEKVDDAIESTSSASEVIRDIAEGSEAVVDDRMEELAELSGEDKAREIDSIT